ncbi:hypothetical protein [Williamsia sp. DF01-3]|nr:hypothetical protein [Williamsia sp. DF01-3]
MKAVALAIAAVALVVAGLLTESRRNIEVWHGLPEGQRDLTAG